MVAETLKCIICERFIEENGYRLTTIGVVCDECYPMYNKINKLLRIRHSKSLKSSLKSISTLFDPIKG